MSLFEELKRRESPAIPLSRKGEERDFYELI